jgi:putative endonuclease
MDTKGKENKRKFGKLGEEIAAKYLAKNGFRVLDMNYRVGRIGELDIIAAEKEYICFIEVKTRTSSFFGAPCESVNRIKQENIRKLAWAYLKHHSLTEKNIRFDIVEITGVKREDQFLPETINLIRNAF